MKFNVFILHLATILSLAACTTYRYEYIAPATESGKTCATQCMTTKQVCYGAMVQQAQSNANVCQQQNSYNYQACVKRAQSHDDVKNVTPIHSIAQPIQIIGNAMNPIDNVLLLVVEQLTYIKTS